MTVSTLRRLALKGAFVCAFAASASAPALAADAVLRVSAIPDEAPTELQRKFAPLGKYLEAQTGMKVVFTPVSDYAAVVESLAALPSPSSSARKMPSSPPSSSPPTPTSSR